MNTSNEFEIELYPEKKPHYTFDRHAIKKILSKDILVHSAEHKPKIGLFGMKCTCIKWISYSSYQYLSNQDKAK